MLYDPKWKQPAETKTEPWRQVQRHAADLIDRFGWQQHCDGNERIGMCVSMALRYAAYDLNLELPGHAWSQAALKFCTWTRVAYIPDYNDLPWQTKENVTSALRTCADQ